MAGLTWLHLSDWHQRGKDFDRTFVRDKLIADIINRKDISNDLAKIDFVIFSGDVTFSGKPEEYQAAKKELFEPILNACGLGPERLFIVPGNHDIDRDKFDLLPAQLSKSLDSDTQAKDWLFDSKKRKAALEPFRAFANFVRRYTHQKNPSYSNIRQYEINGKNIALLGLNSAWMCGRQKNSKDEINDKGVTVVGEPQIHELMERISESDITIAVLHHPFSWLADFESSQIERSLMARCDFILRGHQHEPKASLVHSPDGDCVVIPAGACYDRRIPGDPRYANAYNFVHLNLENGRGVVFLRCWNGMDKWREDIDSAPTEGKFEFNIQSSKYARVTTRGPNSEKLAIPLIPHQIPPPPRDFKGRETEIEEILANFDKGAYITGLRGMGGIGKTALTLVLANKIKDRFPDGHIYLDLRGTSKSPLSSDEAMAQVIRAYRPADRLPEAQNELRGQYYSILSGKKALILFDNAANKEQVEPLLPPEECAVLITSRNKFTLPGLKERDLDVLPSDKARELLLEISPRIGSSADSLADMCGCLPLALRNAASALAERKDIDVREYERRLNDKKARLELVEASFSLSYDLLGQTRKKQWCPLSVFSGDFDLDGGTAVLKMSRDASKQVLSDLVKWSLVDFILPADSGQRRYRLHDLARIFAESRLEPKEDCDAKQRHAKHYLEVLSESEKLYNKGGSNFLAGLILFDSEWENIRAGQAWADLMIKKIKRIKSKSDLKFAMNMANSYANAGINILNLRQHPQEMIRWLETALVAARMSKDQGSEGAHLGNLGNAYADLGEIRKSIEYYDQALAISCKTRDRRNEGGWLGSLGSAYYRLRETNKAICYYNQALAISQEINDRQAEGTWLGNLGNVHFSLGKTRKAIEYYNQALAISRERGNRRNEGADLGNLGSAYADLGEIRKAIKYYDKALGITQEIGDRRGEGTNLDNLGVTFSNLGETSKAIEYHFQALAISREIGARRSEGNCLGNLGNAFAGCGETGKAIEYYDQSLATAREIGDQSLEGENLFNFGEAYSFLGESDKAIEYFKKSLEIVRKIQDRRTESKALCSLGKTYADLGDAHKAIDYFEQSLDIAREIEYRRGEADALFSMSLALDKLSQRQEAIDNAKAALKIFEQIESTNAEEARRKLSEWQE
jgi:tetratricopeptide (TPR) repeat protein/predicted phosphodiesterase